MLSIDFYRPNYDMDVKELVDRLIDLSFAEDIGDGDHTTLCCIPEDAMGKSHLLIKEDGILAGVEVAKEVFHRFDPTMQVEVLMQDGTRVKKGDIAMIVTGKTRSLLQTERLMLNIMQRMSGIATMTDKYVQHLKGTKTRVLDTRKTTPGMRMLEKQAVKIGGGCNHRIGLFDMILLKDNHVDFAGGIVNAIDRCHAYLKEKGLDLKIYVRSTSFSRYWIMVASTVSCSTTLVCPIRRRLSTSSPDAMRRSLLVASRSIPFATMPNKVSTSSLWVR